MKEKIYNKMERGEAIVLPLAKRLAAAHFVSVFRKENEAMLPYTVAEKEGKCLIYKGLKPVKLGDSEKWVREDSCTYAVYLSTILGQKTDFSSFTTNHLRRIVRKLAKHHECLKRAVVTSDNLIILKNEQTSKQEGNATTNS